MERITVLETALETLLTSQHISERTDIPALLNVQGSQNGLQKDSCFLMIPQHAHLALDRYCHLSTALAARTKAASKGFKEGKISLCK